jgi:hypothetical protein
MVLSAGDNARGGGSRWPYPHRGDATEIHPGDRDTCPCGTSVIYDEMNGWQHGDGSVSHDDGESVSDKMRPVPLGAARPGGGYAEGKMGAAEPPRDFNPAQASAPEGSDDGKFPQRRGVPPRPGEFPDQGEKLDDMYPQGGVSSRQSPGGSVGDGSLKAPRRYL